MAEPPSVTVTTTMAAVATVCVAEYFFLLAKMKIYFIRICAFVGTYLRISIHFSELVHESILSSGNWKWWTSERANDRTSRRAGDGKSVNQFQCKHCVYVSRCIQNDRKSEKKQTRRRVCVVCTCVSPIAPDGYHKYHVQWVWAWIKLRNAYVNLVFVVTVHVLRAPFVVCIWNGRILKIYGDFANSDENSWNDTDKSRSFRLPSNQAHTHTGRKLIAKIVHAPNVDIDSTKQ